MGLSIRPFLEADLQRVSDLVAEAGLNAQLDREQWQERAKWLYFGSATLVGTPDIPPGLVAEVDGNLQGFVGFSCRRFQDAAAIQDAVVLGDLAVHPQARGNLGLILSREIISFFAAYSRPVVILGLHHNKVAAAIWSMLGAVPVEGSQTTYGGIVSPGSIVAKKLDVSPAAFRWLDHALLRSVWEWLLSRSAMHLARPTEATGQIDVSTAHALEFNDGLDAMLTMVEASAPQGIVRDRAYLTWRYQRAARQGFTYLHLFDQGKQFGLIVLKTNREGLCFLCDVILHPAQLEVLRAVVSTSLIEAVNCGAASFAAKMTGPGFANAFSEHGLLGTDKAYHQYWIYPKVHAISNATFTFGDFRND